MLHGGCLGALAGRHEDVKHAAQRLQELATQTYVPPVWQMSLYAAAGDREQAFVWADKVLEEHAFAGAIPLKVNPLPASTISSGGPTLRSSDRRAGRIV